MLVRRGKGGEMGSLALLLKQDVFEGTGMSCSRGVAPNNLLAKIFSELEKPNGLTLIKYVDIPSRIWPLLVSKVNGIGPKSNQKLALIGIFTIGGLANVDPNQIGRAHV